MPSILAKTALLFLNYWNLGRFLPSLNEQKTLSRSKNESEINERSSFMRDSWIDACVGGR